MPWVYLNNVMFTSWDSPSALACWTGDTVPASELHIRELRDISTALDILTWHAVVLRARGQDGVALFIACLLGQMGQCLPHDHTLPSGAKLSLRSKMHKKEKHHNISIILHSNQIRHVKT